VAPLGEILFQLGISGALLLMMSGAPRQAVPYYDWRFHPNNKSWTFDKGDKTTTRFGRFEDGKFITGKHSCCRYCAIGCLMVGFQEIPQLPPPRPVVLSSTSSAANASEAPVGSSSSNPIRID
jgi:hypothetical protein